MNSASMSVFSASQAPNQMFVLGRYTPFLMWSPKSHRRGCGVITIPVKNLDTIMPTLGNTCSQKDMALLSSSSLIDSGETPYLERTRQNLTSWMPNVRCLYPRVHKFVKFSFPSLIHLSIHPPHDPKICLCQARRSGAGLGFIQIITVNEIQVWFK
ncbi:hypothetical protein GALMADRAFT_226632 [Galerina marginata CBS 339.88]|uniref:Uncharacterized protein n=1 Tax=Galerina marginata (strain CBS 339.88) TaxID=685588 RepID=A0A067T7P2_GALM3|nr:hypothetical protein GALMADRAFT_226632 [Galerina marginata CBS 339.88]